MPTSPADTSDAVHHDNLRRALAHQDTHSLESVLGAVERGAAQAWCGERSTIITEILDLPLKRVCRIWLAGGDMHELVNEMLPNVEAWAKDNGCARVEIIGRAGWKRVLPEYNEPPQTVLHKEIS